MTEIRPQLADSIGIVAGLRGNAAARRRAVDELYKRYGGRLKHYLARGVTSAIAEALLHEVRFPRLRGQYGYVTYRTWLERNSNSIGLR